MIVGTIMLMALLDPVLLGVTLTVILMTIVLTGSILPRIGRATEGTVASADHRKRAGLD